MKERLSAIIAIVLLLVLIGASYFYALQSGLKNLKYIPSENSPDYTAERISLTSFSAEGKPLRRVTAEKVLHYSDDRLDAEKPRYITLDGEKPQVVAEADRGRTDDAGRTVLFEGNVRITRAAWAKSPETRFETSRLTAYPDTERFVSDAPVRFTRGADLTTGQGMDYRYPAGTIELTGRVKTHIASRK